MIKDHWQSMCLLKLALFLFIPGQPTITEQRSNKNIPRTCLKVVAWSNDTSCDCYPYSHSSSIKYKYKCQVIGANSTISIRLFWGNLIKISCSGLDSLDHRLLPSLAESRYSSVRIFHCPLPPRQPIYNIFSKLGTSLIYVRKLVYKYGAPLELIHFEDLENLKRLKVITHDSKRIILRGKRIKSQRDGLFDLNKNLPSVQFYKNRIEQKKLPETLLAVLPKLREIRLSCGLETIAEDLFVNCKDLRNVTIIGNYLTELPLKLFAVQTKLFDLNLSWNQLKSLPDGIFQNTTELILLRLSHNHLVSITSNIFSALHNLKWLYLDNNDIFTIQSGTFLHTKNLVYLKMQNNKISGELSGLNVSISSHNLIKLDLRYNNITAINNFDLKTVHSVPVVNVSHNSIQRVYFNNYEEVILDLSHNPLNCNCELLPFLQFLKSENATDYIRRIRKTINMFQCSYPKNLEGREVIQLSPEKLLCALDRESFAAQLCPSNCYCWVRPVDGVVVVNCANINLTEMPILPNISRLPLNLPQVHGTALHIENNKLTQLPKANTPGYMHVVELHASNNSLTKVLALNMPRNLTLLDLSQNKIQHLDDTTLSVLNGSRITVALAGNPWVCDCAARGLLDFVVVNNKIIRDVSQMKCEDGQKFQDAASKMICSANQNVVIAVGVVIAVVGICAGIIAAVYYKYQQEIKVWLYAHGMCFWFVSEEDLDKDKQYDAFISFSHRDEDLIADHLLPELENGPTPFKLCLHSRDWVIGEFIPNQILRSVEESRRTIIVLSPNFLESNWAQMEFRSAHNAALKEGRARVIVILYGDVGNVGSLDPELTAYLQMNTYVKWGDPWFWKKLRYAMPHRARNAAEFDDGEPETSNDYIDKSDLPV